MNGLEIVQRIYTRMRRPSQQALPHQTVLDTVREVIARRRMDLAISNQNALTATSQWFTPSSPDFALSDLGLDVMMPIRLERRVIDSEYETGRDVPVVNYEVLNTHPGGDAVSFYGDPLRIVFREPMEYLYEQQFRLIYEGDGGLTTALTGVVGMPGAFRSLIVLEAAWELLGLVEDMSPEWLAFLEAARRYWPAEIADQRNQFDRYVRMFKGRARVPKRTYLDNRSCQVRTKYFKG
jgi:hypothetical protein